MTGNLQFRSFRQIHNLRIYVQNQISSSGYQQDENQDRYPGCPKPYSRSYPERQRSPLASRNGGGQTGEGILVVQVVSIGRLCLRR